MFRPETTPHAAAGTGPARALVLGAARTLSPGYFALVMATGIVSIACVQLGLQPLAWALLLVNWIAYPVLWALTAIRLAVHRPQLFADMSDHRRAPGFFTLVAGTCVFGAQNLVVAGAAGLANLLWWFGLALWAIVTYGFFFAVTIRARKPPLAAGLDGAWLVSAVATQSLVVLRGALDAGTVPPEPIQLLTLSMFMIGSMLYLTIIPLILYRLTFLRLASQDFSPPYWINMGAVAISTLAGATLILCAPDWPLLAPVLPFVVGLTLFFWSVATWWIPLLLMLALWRRLSAAEKPAYEPGLWSMVFPLGMYAAGTFQLGQAMGFAFLKIVPEALIWIALAAWSATMAGLLATLYRSARAIGTGTRHLR